VFAVSGVWFESEIQFNSTGHYYTNGATGFKLRKSLIHLMASLSLAAAHNTAV